MMGFVLLDRDGVLNVDRPGSVCCLEDLEMIPGSAEAIALLNRFGHRVLVITNQACVGRGDLSMETLQAIHGKVEMAVEQVGGTIDGWFVCAHRADEDCACRKPRPGLLKAAQDAYGFLPEVTPFVGDADRDVEAARAAGCVPVLVRTGKGRRAEATYPEVECHEDLLAFAKRLTVH